MATLLVQSQVQDFKQWQKVFDSLYDLRVANGELSAQIYHDHNDHNTVTVVREWKSLESAQQYTQSPEFHKAMEQAGVVGAPSIHFLNQL